ncbi:MAG: [protein-PII] uridylyltransferase [Deltaproteobacteria bacterium]|jgi:[protein-PII] uridylyltransferase|nr:[protein-PII] uridylyltransferase [Deltaproteobacteria bacterium]
MKNPVTQAQHDFFASELMVAGDRPFEVRRQSLLDTAKVYLDHHREICKDLHNKGAGGREVVACTTAMTDELVRNLHTCVTADFPFERQSCCVLIALGGYGRGELNPLSDIDLMFYCSDRNKDLAEQIAERVLYLLWDLNLDVGYSVRTGKDCTSLAAQDITIRTAMLDARFITGDWQLFDEFTQQVYQQVLSRNTQSFLRDKFEEHQNRLSKYGSSVFLLEPNIKEGEGGLRDLHTAIWMARVKYKTDNLRDLLKKGVVTEQEVKNVEDAYDYLWRIRNALHYESKRKNDQLLFEYQEKISKFLGYKSNRTASDVERFMQDYYAHATAVEHLASTLIMKSYQPKEGNRLLGYFSKRTINDDFFIYQGELKASRNSVFSDRPASLMQVFLLAKQHNVSLSTELKGQIRANLHLINDSFRRSRKISELFLEVLRTPDGIGRTLRDMHHLAFLNKYIPEFKRIYCKVQYDAYHIYTVDIHSIFAVEEIDKLWCGEYRDRKPLFTQVADDIEQKELLVLAILFHDIGKGEGKDHSNKGADMIPTIARRLHLGKESSQRLEFLVRHHLDMAHISQRRDMHDDRLIQDFANTMSMTENLKMLFLLTFADIKAVGPDVWSQWKGFLLQELYEKTYDALERGNFMRDLRSERVRNRKRKVLEALNEEFDEKVIKDHLRTMGSRYLLSQRSWQMIEHVRLELNRGSSPVAMQVTHDLEAEYTQVVISTIDVPALFSMIAGVMAANGINILGAQIFTRSNGNALDILHVNKPIGGILDNEAKWEKVRKDLIAVLEGRQQVAKLVKKRQKSSTLITEKKRPRSPSRINFDNETSVEYTVIDIFTHDQIGLLYRVTQSLADFGLYIFVAKISTKVDQVADTFYVKDIFGQKVQDPAKIEELRSVLLECIDQQS